MTVNLSVSVKKWQNRVRISWFRKSITFGALTKSGCSFYLTEFEFLNKVWLISFSRYKTKDFDWEMVHQLVGECVMEELEMGWKLRVKKEKHVLKGQTQRKTYTYVQQTKTFLLNLHTIKTTFTRGQSDDTMMMLWWMREADLGKFPFFVVHV